MRKCILDEERNCMECGRCDYCDLDPEKICDNCCKCIEKNADYSSVMIERIVPEKFNYHGESRGSTGPSKAQGKVHEPSPGSGEGVLEVKPLTFPYHT